MRDRTNDRTEITCSVCKRLVEIATIERGVFDISLGAVGTRVTVYCHGDQDRAMLGRRDMVPLLGVAFRQGRGIYDE